MSVDKDNSKKWYKYTNSQTLSFLQIPFNIEFVGLITFLL